MKRVIICLWLTLSTIPLLAQAQISTDSAFSLPTTIQSSSSSMQHQINTAGTYPIMFSTADGCDSLISTTLIINQLNEKIINRTIGIWKYLFFCKNNNTRQLSSSWCFLCHSRLASIVSWCLSCHFLSDSDCLSICSKYLSRKFFQTEEQKSRREKGPLETYMSPKNPLTN